MSKLILIDLDKTLLDVGYNLTVDLSENVRCCQKRGFLVGLSSDSALETLVYWAAQIGASGPIVFEKGAGIYFPETGEQIPLNARIAARFPKVREQVVSYFVAKAPQWTVFVGDSTEEVRRGYRPSGHWRRLVLVNGLRRYSFAAYVRSRYEAGPEPIISTELLTQLRLAAEQIAVRETENSVDVDENAEYGIVIIHALNTCKGKAVVLLQNEGRYDKIICLGDSMLDFVGDSTMHCAVANASEDFRQRCEMVAELPFTAGVQEILRKISEQ